MVNLALKQFFLGLVLFNLAFVSLTMLERGQKSATAQCARTCPDKYVLQLHIYIYKKNQIRTERKSEQPVQYFVKGCI